MLFKLLRMIFGGSKPAPKRYERDEKVVPITRTTVHRRDVSVTVNAERKVEQVVSQSTVSVAVTVPEIISGRCYVVDGDTIRIGDVSLRLAGIDAPELDHPYGQQAKWHLAKLCKGQEIRAEVSPELSYDRLVATCFLPDGRDLSAEMVKAGLAIDWPKFSKGKYAQFEPPDARKKRKRPA